MGLGNSSSITCSGCSCGVELPHLNLSGVADVVISVQWKCVGEIKGKNDSGYVQTLAEMEAKSLSTQWPFGMNVYTLMVPV